jgi:hypothetical protein
VAITLIFGALCLVGFGPPVLLGSDGGPGEESSAMSAATLRLANVPPVPPIQASAAAVVDGEGGALVWGKNPHQAFPPASMTKILTALIALQRGNPDQLVTSDVDATTMAGDSVMGLHPGERLALRDYLYGLLVPSGDDAALVIAKDIGGDETKFVADMNDGAGRLGLTDSHFVNPHGLDATGQLASPYDMIVVARAAMSYPLFRQIVATQHVTIQGRWTYTLTNTNLLLGRRSDVIGVKTGTTDAALHAITVAAAFNGHVLYVTVMHTPDYVPDVTALLDHFEAVGDWLDLTLPDSPLYHVSISGQDHVLGIASNATVYIPRWQASSLTREVDLTPDSTLRATDNPDLPPPNDGAVTFYAEGSPIARLPLRLR